MQYVTNLLPRVTAYLLVHKPVLTCYWPTCW